MKAFEMLKAPTAKCHICKRETPYPPTLTAAQVTTRNPKAKIFCPEHGKIRAIFLVIQHRKRMLSK